MCQFVVDPLLDDSHNLPTPINGRIFYLLLEGYDHDSRDYIHSGFTKGFDIDYVGNGPCVAGRNSLSVIHNPVITQTLVDKEVLAGRVAGPFANPPFGDFQVSPLSLRPKRTPGEFRLIHDLSFPYNKQSVNANIPHDKCTVSYASVDDAINIILSLGPNCYLAKCDIKSAFRLIPVSPSNYYLLGFQLGGKYYHDRCLAMGCSSACRIFESVSTALHWVMREKFGLRNLVHYIDDFLICEESFEKCAKSLEIFESVCQKIQIPLAPEKTEGPAQQLSFLGVHLDTVHLMASLPDDKLTKYSNEVSALLGSENCKMHEIRALAGRLQWATDVIRSGKGFLRRIYSAYAHTRVPYSIIPISSDLREDLLIWHCLFENHNGSIMMDRGRCISSADLGLYTDASKTGCAGILGRKWFQIWFPESWYPKNIAIKEMYPIMVAMYVFGDLLADKYIVMHTDNHSVMDIINKQSSKDPELMSMVRQLVLCCLLRNIKFTARHIAGVDNVNADRLSRFQVTARDLVNMGLNLLPESIPVPLMPLD